MYRQLESSLDEEVACHLKVLQHLTVNPRRQQTNCVQAVGKMLQDLKDENWLLPVVYMRRLAAKCED